jgi:hypothetical protein
MTGSNNTIWLNERCFQHSLAAGLYPLGRKSSLYTMNLEN